VYLECFDAQLRVEFAALLEAAVDYEADTRDSDRGFRDVRREDDFTVAGRRRGEGFVLNVGGECGVQRTD
jgi:hypothetical protein